jgi:hypothetical protein
MAGKLEWTQDEHGYWRCQPSPWTRAEIWKTPTGDIWACQVAFLNAPRQWIGMSPSDWRSMTSRELAELWCEEALPEMERRVGRTQYYREQERWKQQQPKER